MPSNEPRAAGGAADGPPVLSRTLHAGLTRVNDWLKAHSVTTLVTVVALGLLFPQAGAALKGLDLFRVPGTGWVFDFQGLALALITLSAAIHCRPEHFRQIPQRRRAALLHLASVYLIVPALAGLVSVAAAHAFEGEAGVQIRIGIMFIAFMPVAMTSSLWVNLNRGNVSLLLAVIMVTALLAVVTIPLYSQMLPLPALGKVPIYIPVSYMVGQVVMSVTVPLLVGVWLQQRAARFVGRWGVLFSLLGTLGLLSSLASSVAVAAPRMAAEGTLILSTMVVTIALNLGLFWVALAASHRLDLPQEDAISLVFSSGMRNMGAAMVIGGRSFPDMPLVTVPAAIFSLSQQIIAGVLSRSLEQPAGRLFGPAIGTERETLEQYIDEALSRNPNREPRLSLVAFRVAQTSTKVSDILLAVRRRLRSMDFVCRLGPQEFVVVLLRTPQTSGAFVARKVERLLAERAPELQVRSGIAHATPEATGYTLLQAAFSELRVADDRSQEG